MMFDLHPIRNIAVPRWAFGFGSREGRRNWDAGKRYTGADLRKIRAERGVGRPPRKTEARA